ncbi:MAG: hypothetical protein AUJ92_05400 [Armatimonadetes bacterium CG2_30_59_28]|nr:KpsF/GutQ family sugar-phosphate isomerase [Armatimonadota bacterium]OIO96707.1 MAG: hypothetical protein AUJ92_05400 [Armatimonadetes bacterium CG2_30_59_28]PIU63897.1 MAG: KpsF/GutQ family sugar-phosphate isomerase [Armatimonadetes bacterium CG07_land_8_20_14_0_80_59_28]PIX44133.1 MAG: KpsF/GutQ family sugar-phosphate isomerase [Armatimonadetes bacterium CG_4_8_14_3_um_filter_58_9]PIY45944.1 MAG: KpsF/GutQ family sugar-phosphate isomerase [Armatimonadetes bacterium CG_4_10_14_3_um_filter_5
MKEANILESARRVLVIESAAIASMSQRLDNSLERAVALILACTGRVVVTGVGKSGVIGRKIASTLASTGTPALFLHSGEGLHGDLGMLTSVDVLMAISYSGHSDDLLSILPVAQDMGVPIIALTGQGRSHLAMNSDVVLDVSVEREADPNNLAPTASTATTLAMGDALAIAVMGERKFGREDFLRFHPGGSLGRGLTLRVKDIMRTGDRMALVRESVLIREVLFCITRARAGAATVVDEAGRLRGIVTDGDIRRHLLQNSADMLEKPAGEVMTRTPTTVHPEMMAVDAMRLLEERDIDELPVVDDDGNPVGVLDVQDLLRAGLPGTP